MFGKKKTNWDLIRDRRPEDTIQYRDVYADQQLERGRIKERQKPTLHIIFSVIVAVIVVAAVYGVGIVFSFAKNYYDHIKQTEIVGDFDSPDDVFLIDGKLIHYAQKEHGSYPKKDNPSEREYRAVWFALNEDGTMIKEPFYETKEEVPYPDWVQKKLEARPNPDTKSEKVRANLIPIRPFQDFYPPTTYRVLASLLAGLVTYLLIYEVMMRNLAAQNLISDTSDINQHHNDQHIMLPEEVQQKFDWFPDVGAHCSVQVSSMISHMALSNKGVKQIECGQFYEKNVKDKDGNIIHEKGEMVVDEAGNFVTKRMPMFDTAFMEALFDASNLPNDKNLRKYYDPSKIAYNKGNKNREKLKGYSTVADMINGDWTIPHYEPQRPAGAYMVDPGAVNTMIIAITRGGKGQGYIEPVIDMWTREKNPSNSVINDPKGELLVKNYVRATIRGFQVVQFNLINALKTDIYNPLAMAADAAREGDFTKCAMYVNNIANVFFPVDGAEDPVWPNAANNAFKRAAYGLIDYYLEEEKEYRQFAEETNMDQSLLESELDRMWGKVTLYNCYQFFVQLTSKKLKNPLIEFTKQVKEGALKHLSYEEHEARLEKAEKESALWEDRPEIDLLTLYFNATSKLPKNEMRTLISNADNSLRAMAGAEKMLASVYGIAITAMSFFTDPTISTLTSGTPSQNVDLAGLSFPRRFGVKFHSDFVEKYHLVGLQVRWQGYEDDKFTKSLGKDFYHEDLIGRDGWSKGYFAGIFENDVSYLMMEIVNPQSGMLINTFYFKFQKAYQTSLSGRTYFKDPVTGAKIVKNGTLEELRPVTTNGEVSYKKERSTFVSYCLKDIDTIPKKEKFLANSISQFMVRYSEKPKMIFLVTPPHITPYAKILLILLKQLVDLNFEQSYMKKANQKPLYRTRFMLDELGNLQSDGKGIADFQTMLSIGLGLHSCPVHM